MGKGAHAHPSIKGAHQSFPRGWFFDNIVRGCAWQTLTQTTGRGEGNTGDLTGGRTGRHEASENVILPEALALGDEPS